MVAHIDFCSAHSPRLPLYQVSESQFEECPEGAWSPPRSPGRFPQQPTMPIRLWRTLGRSGSDAPSGSGEGGVKQSFSWVRTIRKPCVRVAPMDKAILVGPRGVMKG